MTAYPMPNLIIKKVEQFSKASNATPNVFDFVDRNGVLFEWNNKFYECPEGMIKEDMVLYPSLVAEVLGIILNQDQPILLIGDKIEPQGRTEDAAARNANIEPFNIAGVDAPTIVRTNDNEINKINDDNNNIMSIARQPATQIHSSSQTHWTTTTPTKMMMSRATMTIQATMTHCKEAIWGHKEKLGGTRQRRTQQRVKLKECANQGARTKEQQETSP
jgi:hypothetical protein